MSQHQGPLAHSRGIPEDIVRLGSLQITSSWDHSTSNDHFLRIKPNPPHTPCYLRSSRFKNGERTGSGWSKLGKLWVYPILAHFAGFDIPAISCQWSIAKLCKTAGLSAIWSNSMPMNPDQLINPFFLAKIPISSFMACVHMFMDFSWFLHNASHLGCLNMEPPIP